MTKAEIIKEIRKQLALNVKEEDILAFLLELGHDKEDAKQLIEDSKKGFEIDKDLERLRSIDGQPMSEDDIDESKLSPQQQRIRYVKRELGDLQDILRSISSDVRPEPVKKSKKGKRKSKNKK